MKYLINQKNLKLKIVLLFTLAINFAEAKNFIIGVEAIRYYPLYDFSANDTTKPSFTKEILSVFFDANNYQYQFVALPIKRFDKWYIEKNIDFKFPDNFRWRKDKENKLNITFSQSVVKLIAGTYVLKNNKESSRNDIKRLGTILGFVPTLWFDKIGSDNFTLVEESSPISVIRHLLHGNVDATNIDPNVIQHNLKQLKENKQIVLNKNIKHEEFSYHLSSIKHPEIIREFNNFLNNNKELVESIKEKYGIDENFD